MKSYVLVWENLILIILESGQYDHPDPPSPSHFLGELLHHQGHTFGCKPTRHDWLIWEQSSQTHKTCTEPWHPLMHLSNSTSWLLALPASIPWGIDFSLSWQGLFGNAETFQMILARPQTMSWFSSWFHPFGASESLSKLSSVYWGRNHSSSFLLDYVDASIANISAIMLSMNPQS